MKTIILMCAAVTIVTSAFAQKTQMQDGIMKKDVKVWYIKSLTGPMTLNNGVEAMTDGTIKLNGKTIILHDGDCINFQGQMVGMNQNNANMDGLVVRTNGTMWVYSILNRPIEFSNGTYAMPDGTIKLQDGKYVKISNKEFINMDGNTAFASK